MSITPEQLDALRQQVRTVLSVNRLTHTLSVEEEAAGMAGLLLPEKENAVRAAALLHDITKQMPLPQQEALCRSAGIVLTAEDLAAPKTLHARSAPARILAEFPTFATPEILDAVRLHTTGGAGMSVFSKIIFLADYTEPLRPYPACRETRASFWWEMNAAESAAARLQVLDRTVLAVLAATMVHLLQSGQTVALDSLRAYNQLLLSLSKQA